MNPAANCFFVICHYQTIKTLDNNKKTDMSPFFFQIPRPGILLRRRSATIPTAEQVFFFRDVTVSPPKNNSFSLKNNVTANPC
jgi:hypothetical protein